MIFIPVVGAMSELKDEHPLRIPLRGPEAQETQTSWADEGEARC